LRNIVGWNCGSARFLTFGLPLAGAFALWVCAATPLCAHAQSSESGSIDGPSNEVLPDAPEPADAVMVSAQEANQASRIPARTHETTHHDRLIDPTEIAPKVNAFDKMVMGFEGAVSPYAVVGWVGISTYEQAFDRSPNYGQTGKGYVQRLGAAAARDSSEGIFTYALYSPIFHTDPRYYVLGPGHGFAHRAAYAISRVLVTKTDAGGQTVNFALLSGNLTGAAITQTYYPAGNRNLEQVMTTFGTSLGGAAFGYLFDEFIVNSAEFLQLKHKVDLGRGSTSN
jgi:hypothetical protein